ncbi:hypothetical protein BC938DRAFT_477486 [Jimgerdemannia flammicorona]|uniref:Uncharacterized protein n=1 Tax=Jimgerdemannia flammicorona TaxID=994334 RepID=A0A433P9P7_9FUNG|nr:hypothetical protein BC938DRAFT_477486 [Jimgerdemannia flammicorona]
MSIASRAEPGPTNAPSTSALKLSPAPPISRGIRAPTPQNVYFLFLFSHPRLLSIANITLTLATNAQPFRLPRTRLRKGLHPVGLTLPSPPPPSAVGIDRALAYALWRAAAFLRAPRLQQNL